MSHKRIATSAEVYAVIFARHSDKLKVFASFSDPEGTWMHGSGTTGRMETAWGIDGSDCPLLEIRTTYPITRSEDGLAVKGGHLTEYWLCYSVGEE